MDMLKGGGRINMFWELRGYLHVWGVNMHWERGYQHVWGRGDQHAWGVYMLGGATCFGGLHALRGAGGYMLDRGGATCLAEGGYMLGRGRLHAWQRGGGGLHA